MKTIIAQVLLKLIDLPFLSGYKTIIGASLTVVAQALRIISMLPFAQDYKDTIESIAQVLDSVGVGFAGVGLTHKVIKRKNVGPHS